MSFAKELLFSCVVMMQVSLMVMHPLAKQSIYKSLEDFGLPLGSLRLAEKNYVELIFHKGPPIKYNNSSTWKLSEGITFGNTTEEIQASVCAIKDYLGNHLPNITRNLTNQFDPILSNVTSFLYQFKTVERTVEMENCSNKKLQTSDFYTRKVTGLRFLYSSRRWVEHFIQLDRKRDN